MDNDKLIELRNDYTELLKRHNDSFEQFKLLKMICDDYRLANAELENECEKYKRVLDEIMEVIKQTCKQRCTNECMGTRKHCGYGKIYNIINKAKEV